MTIKYINYSMVLYEKFVSVGHIQIEPQPPRKNNNDHIFSSLLRFHTFSAAFHYLRLFANDHDIAIITSLKYRIRFGLYDKTEANIDPIVDFGPLSCPCSDCVCFIEKQNILAKISRREEWLW